MTADDSRLHVQRASHAHRARQGERRPYSRPSASISTSGTERSSTATSFRHGLETAYPVFNVKTDGAKFYCAGFRAEFYHRSTPFWPRTPTVSAPRITAEVGSSKARGDTDECDAFEFGVDSALYRLGTPPAQGGFYARPSPSAARSRSASWRSSFSTARPDYVINLAAGTWRPGRCRPVRQPQSLKIEQLPALYDKCAVALVLADEHVAAADGLPSAGSSPWSTTARTTAW